MNAKMAKINSMRKIVGYSIRYIDDLYNSITEALINPLIFW